MLCIYKIIKKYALLVFLIYPLLGFSHANKNPNIIIIVADDLGWGDVGYHGSEIKTPNIDRLSREGVILNRFYTAPICSPTRAGLLTGRYPNRFGIRETTIEPGMDFGLDTSEVLLPQLLANAGYTNRAVIGKWHLGNSDLMYTPLKRGFTHFYGCYNGRINYFSHMREGELDWHNDYETSYDNGYATDLITDEATKCIRGYAGDPFFLYIAYNAPHSPQQAKKEDLLLYGFDETKPVFEKSTPGGDEDTRLLGHGNTRRQTYSAMVTCMDRGIGKILQTLNDLDIDDNTIVLFHSDNGARKSKGGEDQTGSNGVLKGAKWTEWEGGVRVPAIIKWPAQFAGGRTVNQVMGYIDVMPTISEIVAVKPAPAKPFDGVSVASVLRGEVKQIDRTFYLGHGSIIMNDWKLIRANSGNDAMKISEDMLFSIPPDYSEENNLRDSHREVYEQLVQAVVPYDAIKAKKELPERTELKSFTPPKEWQITGDTVPQSGDLKHFPAGSSPLEVGNRVAAHFVASPHSNYGKSNPPKLITYPEVCTWYGALLFSRLTDNRKLQTGLIDRFQPLFNEEAHLVPIPDHVDRCVFGTLPLEIYKLSKDKKYLKIGKHYADVQWDVPKGMTVSSDSFKYAQQGLSWQTRMWIDDMYMMTIIQTEAYRTTGKKKYITRAAREMVTYLDSLQRPNGLFYHAPDVPFFWGRGNGWVAAGMAEVLYSLPKNDPNRAHILAGFQKMMNALLKFQTEKGVWRQLVDDPASWEETSGTGMFTYAMIMGVKQGWLDKETFAPAARKAWLALVSYLDEDANIREVCQGTKKLNDRQHYMDRKRLVGDMHGQAPVLWCVNALLR